MEDLHLLEVSVPLDVRLCQPPHGVFDQQLGDDEPVKTWATSKLTESIKCHVTASSP